GPTPLDSLAGAEISRTASTTPSAPAGTGLGASTTGACATCTGGGGGVPAKSRSVTGWYSGAAGFGARAATCFFAGLGAGVALAGAGGMTGASTATGCVFVAALAATSGAPTSTDEVVSFAEPSECGSTPVRAPMPTAEKRVTEIAAAVSRG